MILILSDTHDNTPALRRALASPEAKEASLIVHCGDITLPDTLDEFAGFPVRLVLGNCDICETELNQSAARLGFSELGETLEFAHSGKTFFVYHGTRADILDAALRSQKYHYILTGHSHRQRNEKCGKTRIINPGALYRASTYSIALLDPVKDSLRFVPVEK